MNGHAPRIRGESALRRVKSPRMVGKMARALAWIIPGGILTMAFVPWQQTAKGFGRVIAYAPLERTQAITAPLDGRVTEWKVQEGDLVNEGDLMAVIADNDPDLLDRLGQELTAVKTSIHANQASAHALEKQIEALEEARTLALSAAEANVKVAQQKVRAQKRALEAEQAVYRTAKLNLTRREKLGKEGLVSQRDLELAELSAAKARTSVAKAKAALEAARGSVLSKEAEREQKAADNLAKIAKVRSSLEKARSDLAKANADRIKVETKLARQARMEVRAPRDGTVLRLIVRANTEFVSPGDPIATLVPESTDRAVELWVSGNDAPLAAPGRKVRLQFEGWPAVQFSGWPSVAVGTFGGVVAFADATADASGRFRVVVRPDPDDNPWPVDNTLRQGVRANGWVLLDQVTIGFELWRQLNGFPASVPADDPLLQTGDKDGKKKKKKKKKDDK
ncbi:MAG: HlyD family secretion protein [Bradymonadia bacterium]